jgi:hypothetical protein
MPGCHTAPHQNIPVTGHKSAKVTLDTYADLFDDDLDAVADTLHARYGREVSVTAETYS